MKKLIQVLFIGLTVFLVCFMTGTPVMASSDASFHVSPVLPANQTAGVKGYFDLMVTPGQVQDLSVKVVNTDSKDMVVEVEAITASTNLNGVVNYTTHGEQDASLPQTIAELLYIEEPIITIPANSAKTVTVQVRMPEDEYDGYLLGSIHIKKQLTDAQLNSGEAILNQFSYAVAVKLRENDTVIKNDFMLDGIQVELKNGRASIVNRIVNPQPILVKGMDTEVKILPKGSKTPIMERVMENTSMAPNSVFPFTLMDDAGYGIRAGVYVSKININYDDRTWTFEEEFEISAEEADDINSGAVNLDTTQTILGLPLWAAAVMAVGAVLLIAAVILLIYLMRKMKEQKEK